MKKTVVRLKVASVLSCRSSQKDCHLALPYYRMSGLSVTEIMARNRPLPSSPHTYGPGFLFYLKHFLLEETEQILSQVHTVMLHILLVCCDGDFYNQMFRDLF